MPKFTPKVPLAHAPLVLPDMLSIAAALLRFSLLGCPTNAYSSTKVLTRHCMDRLCRPLNSYVRHTQACTMVDPTVSE